MDLFESFWTKRYGVDQMWPKLLHAENLEEDLWHSVIPSLVKKNGSPCGAEPPQEHLRHGTFFWDVGAEVVLAWLYLALQSYL